MSNQQQQIDAIVGYGISSFVALTGILGWVQSRSAPSLIAGVASGALLGVGTARTLKDSKNVDITVVMSTVLIGLMAHKTWSHNFRLALWPSGIIAGLSTIMLFRFAPRLIKNVAI